MDSQLDVTDRAAELRYILDGAYRRGVAVKGGAVADYIPELTKADPDRFGIAVATATGQIHALGDVEVPFTIQSVGKAMIYCSVLGLVGREAMLARVGVEPSGDAFNAIAFDPHTRRPFNPMVNAGAITVAGLLIEAVGDDAFDFTLDRLSRAAGRQLDVDEAVYRSESETGHRNRAIAHLLLAAGAIAGPVEPVVDLYFRQCSIRTTAVDLAWIGATLANMGTHPVTGDEIFEIGATRDTLTLMFTCGMYDFAGNWAFDVGIPAKSGVGGGIIGVVNRQLGIGTYSPLLDAKGNSMRGIAAFAALSDELGLHAFDCTNRGSSLVASLLR